MYCVDFVLESRKTGHFRATPWIFVRTTGTRAVGLRPTSLYACGFCCFRCLESVMWVFFGVLWLSIFFLSLWLTVTVANHLALGVMTVGLRPAEFCCIQHWKLVWQTEVWVCSQLFSLFLYTTIRGRSSKLETACGSPLASGQCCMKNRHRQALL